MIKKQNSEYPYKYLKILDILNIFKELQATTINLIIVTTKHVKENTKKWTGYRSWKIQKEIQGENWKWWSLWFYLGIISQIEHQCSESF